MSDEKGPLHTDSTHIQVTLGCFGVLVPQVSQRRAATQPRWLSHSGDGGNRLHGCGRSSLSSAVMQGSCQYRGYIEGVPSSAVTLSTCSGLR